MITDLKRGLISLAMMLLGLCFTYQALVTVLPPLLLNDMNVSGIYFILGIACIVLGTWLLPISKKGRTLAFATGFFILTEGLGILSWMTKDLLGITMPFGLVITTLAEYFPVYFVGVLLIGVFWAISARSQRIQT